MTEQIAKAQYEGQWNPPEDDYLAWDDCSIPPEKTDSPEHVAPPICVSVGDSLIAC